MRALRGIVGVSAALLAGASLIGPAQADAADAWAWWYSARMSELPPLAPPPPSVPEDGLYVSSGPSGASAISAVRAHVDPDASTVRLVLELVDVVGTPILGACHTKDSWEPISAGNWDEKPEADCAAGSAPGAISANATTVTFEVASLVRDGAVNVLIVPGVDDSGVPSSFSASFAAPAESTVQEQHEFVPAPPTTSSDAEEPSMVSATPPPPVTFTPTPGLGERTTPDTAVDVPPIVPTERTRDVLATRNVFSDSTDAGGSIAGALVAAALFGLFLVLKERGDRGRAILGPVPLAVGRQERGSAEIVSGIGRFRGPRHGVPPSLS